MRTALISNYYAVDMFALSESRQRAEKPPTRPYTTYDLTYFVSYSVMGENLKIHHSIHHKWNVEIDGFPTKARLRKWCQKHEYCAERRGNTILVVAADIISTTTREKVASVNYE